MKLLRDRSGTHAALYVLAAIGVLTLIFVIGVFVLGAIIAMRGAP